MACHRQKIRWFFLVNTSNRIRCINWRTQLHGFIRDTEFLTHAEGNYSEGISKFLLLKTTSTQRGKNENVVECIQNKCLFLLNCAIFRDYSVHVYISTDVEEQDGEYYKYMRSKFIRTTSHCHLYP